MLVELSVVEQRYHAVMEVAVGVPVTGKLSGSRRDRSGREMQTDPRRIDKTAHHLTESST